MAKMMRMPTVRKALHRFDNVPSIRGLRSVFNYSHPHKTTFGASLLIPVFCREVLPGDSWAASVSGFARLSSSALKTPMMDNAYWETWWFYAPMRILWTNAVKFFGEQVNPADSINFTIPVVTVPFTPVQGSLYDYFGIFPALGTGPVQTPNAINTLPFRMYFLMYNQWFRDQNLINSVSVPLTDGPDAWGGSNFPLRRAKRPDYFTSALPTLQKGAATSAAVSAVSVGAVPTWMTGGVGGQVMERTDVANPTAVRLLGSAGATGADIGWDNPNLTVLISDLRQAVMVQEFLERDLRGGTRYPELVEQHFGVANPDARVQRVEYLGGGRAPIIVNPVTQQTQGGLTGSSTPQGNLTGVGSVFVNKHGFHHSFTEHGYLLCIVNVFGDVTYYQGIERMWTRRTRFEFYWREFAHLSEQAVLNQEIFWQATTAANAVDIGVFGYVPRYEEYRFAFGRVSGKFRGNDATPLDMWHLAQEFGALPTLGQTFIEDSTDTSLDRVLAVNTEPDIIADLWFDIKVARPIPVYGIPGFAKRF